MLELKHITKVYNTEPRHLVEVISDLTLSVADGEFIALVGPSGCGKTTLLKMVAGLVPQTSGEIFLDKQAVFLPE